ncbi:MAG TPA: serine hydrolase, partial [Ruminococcaceae bacterium]|nr:serine hydrolase [Oscillospiraceae bacterium]
MFFETVNETEVGFSAGTTRQFVTKLASSRVCLHSLLLMRNGKVFAEEYAPGYDKSFRHRLYSSSKTYVSAAVGVAIGEGLITLETKVAAYFPDKLPENPHPYITDLTVRDCLIMATPFDETPYRNYHTDWVKDFFTAEPTHRGGSIFNYDTGAT